MKASELIEKLRALISEHGDKEMAVDCDLGLAEIEDVDLTTEEDDVFCIWLWKK